MEKEMLVHLKFKEGKLETFTSWMQSDEGMALERVLLIQKKPSGL